MHTPTAMVTLCSVILACLAPWNVWGHAFPQRSEPAVGATLTVSPPRVRIWFDALLEAAFSRLQVQTVSGQRLAKNDAQGNPTDATLREPPLQRLPPRPCRLL